MIIHLDENQTQTDLPCDANLSQVLDWVGAHCEEGRIITRVELGENIVDGPALANAHEIAIAGRSVVIGTTSQQELSRTMIGKLAALVEYLGVRQRGIAALIEQGQTPRALEQLGDILNAWQQVQQAFGSLSRLMRLDLQRQFIGDRPAVDLIDDFKHHLEQIQRALENQDMVLLGDVLQYEMDAVAKNWNDLLAVMLGLVDGVLEPVA